jgi:hypothetical protein
METPRPAHFSPPPWDDRARLPAAAAVLALLGAGLVAAAWSRWPSAEGLAFEVVFSIGMLGVNAAWPLGVWSVLREAAAWARGRRPRRAAWLAGGFAVVVSSGVFW